MKKYAIGMYEKAVPASLNWKEKMEVARESGYDFIEISLDETDEKLSRLEWSISERKELVDLMISEKMPIRSMCLSGHRKYPMGDSDLYVEAQSIYIMQKAIELADDLGIRIIQLAGYDVYYKKGDANTRKRFIKNLKIAAEMASIKGIMLGFETMETPFMNTVEKAMVYVKEVHSPYLGVYPDLGNLTNSALEYHANVLDDLQKGFGHLISMHLKETRPGVFREVPFGTGYVDFSSGIHAAWGLGIRRYVTELWFTGSPEWKKNLRQMVMTLSTYLDSESDT